MAQTTTPVTTKETVKLITTDNLVNTYLPTPNFTNETTLHTVEDKQTLEKIAKIYGVGVDAIKEENKAYFDKLAAINKANKTYVTLEAGVKLNITTRKAKDLNYTVQKG